MLKRRRAYSTSIYRSDYREWAFSLSVKSTRLSDTPNPGGKSSHFQSRVLDPSWYSESWYSEYRRRAFSLSIESTRHPDTPNPGSARSRFQSRLLDTLILRIQEASVLAFSREYSTFRYSESRKCTISLSVESTRPFDIPRAGGERSRPPLNVLDAAIVIAITRTGFRHRNSHTPSRH